MSNVDVNALLNGEDDSKYGILIGKIDGTIQIAGNGQIFRLPADTAGLSGIAEGNRVYFDANGNITAGPAQKKTKHPAPTRSTGSVFAPRPAQPFGDQI